MPLGIFFSLGILKAFTSRYEIASGYFFMSKFKFCNLDVDLEDIHFLGAKKTITVTQPKPLCLV